MCCSSRYQCCSPFLLLLTWKLGVPGGVNVALPTNITAEDVAKVINEAELVGMACSVDELATLAPVLGACRTLRTFVVMDHEGCTNPQLPALVKQANPSKAKVHAMAFLLRQRCCC